MSCFEGKQPHFVLDSMFHEQNLDRTCNLHCYIPYLAAIEHAHKIDICSL